MTDFRTGIVCPCCGSLNDSKVFHTASKTGDDREVLVGRHCLSCNYEWPLDRSASADAFQLRSPGHGA